jgi:type II secretory pathway component PulL
MDHTYLSLLVALKEAKAEKSSEDFVNYLMLKYAAREPLYDAIKDWHPYFIDEDKETLEIILTETKWPT